MNTQKPPSPQMPIFTVKAKYTDTEVDRYRGNPLIEALPALLRGKAEFDSFVENIPPVPTDRTRKKSEVVRMMEAMTIKDVVYPFPEYSRASADIATLIRDSYVSRNPMTSDDVQRRHALATGSRDGLAYPSDWSSSADGYFMISVTGMGKSTWANGFLVRHPQLIRHEMYRGKPVPCRYQVVYLYLRVPFNGTLSALCLQFFRKVDKLLGTNYLRQAKALRSVAPMVELMSAVASTISLSFIVMDELQNLRSAHGENAEIALNYLTEIIEGIGISVICLATPKIYSVLAKNAESTRKLSSLSGLMIEPMKKGDPQWKTFCELNWDYTYVKRKPRLDETTMNVWHEVSGGNTAFAKLAFLLTQRYEIGGREIVDVDGLRRTSACDMAFLRPAIAALNSGDPKKLGDFDDMIYGAKYRGLQRLLGIDSGSPGVGEYRNEPEFDDFQRDVAQREKRRRKSKEAKQQIGDDWTDELSTLDPLIS